jgi:hypothetical protein
MDYEFQKESVKIEKLQSELSAFQISGLSFCNGVLVVHTASALSQQDLDAIAAIVASHDPSSPNEWAIQIISGAINFANGLIIEFAGENVAMGITQAGKTKAVADYLADLMRYAQSGSLYEVVNEIDRLILAGLPVDLEPFITETRMLAFKQRILDYLT